MNVFDEILYNEIDYYFNELYDFLESTDYEFMSNEELERLEEEVWK